MEENQEHIPEGWNEITQLGTYCKVFNGLSGKTKDDFGAGQPYIPYVNVFKNSKIDITELDYVKIKAGEKQNAVQYGDLIFTTSSETIEEVGMTSVFLEKSGTYFLNSFCFILRITNAKWLVPEFSQYLFRTDNVRHSISLLGQGSTRYNLSKTRLLKELNLILPSNTTEQTQIATILSKVDEAITQTEQLIAKYTRIKTGLMQDLLTKGIDENGNIRSEETHEFKDSALGRIPEEWECLTIGDISERLRSGVTPKGGSDVYQKEGIMLVRSQNVYSYGFKLADIAFISEEINSRMLGSQLETFDVLLNITGASIGRSTFVPENHPLSNVNQHVCSIRIKNTSLDKAVYLSSFLNSIYGQNQIQQNNAGSNREGINYNQIRAIYIPWFSKDSEFINFKKIISKATEKIDLFKKSHTKLQSLKTGLMQDLLSGKVRVNHLIKEVASV